MNAADDTGSHVQIISEADVISFFRCQRLPYLNRHGSPSDQEEKSSWMEQLRQERLDHQADIRKTHPGSWVDPTKSWQERVQQTQTWMAEGIRRIYGACLEGELIPGIQGRSQIDGLIWHQGSYWPIEIRASKQAKTDYEVILAFHALVLGGIQGQTPRMGGVLLREGKLQRLRLHRWLRELPKMLQTYEQVMGSPAMPEVYMARSRCGMCAWQSFCRQHTAESDPLRLLPGITRTRHPLLTSLGITTIEHLAQTPVETLLPLRGFGPKTAQQLIRQAQATHTQQPVWIQPVEGISGFNPWPENVEFCFDVEADPLHDVSYLLGVLRIENGIPISYQALLAKDPAQEQEIWEQFLALMERDPQAPIYHFHEFEVRTCRKLALKYGTSQRQLQRLLKRFVDLDQVVTQSVVLPVESYSLKNMARWLGFAWQRADAGGAQSIVWYTQWLETRDPQVLGWLTAYNEDDCRATYVLKAWLATTSPPLNLSDLI